MGLRVAAACTSIIRLNRNALALLSQTLRFALPQICACASRQHIPHFRTVFLERWNDTHQKHNSQKPTNAVPFIQEGYILITLLLDLNIVRLFPSLIVPPICPGLCSGMSITCQDKNRTFKPILVKTLLEGCDMGSEDNLLRGDWILD